MSDKARRLRIGGFVALAVAVAALALGWYFTAAATPGPVDRQREAQIASLDRVAAVAEAHVSLATVRADLAAERGTEGLPRRLRHVSDKLEMALRDHVREADTDAWSEVEAALGRLEEQVLRSDPAATDTAGALLDMLRTFGP